MLKTDVTEPPEIIGRGIKPLSSSRVLEELNKHNKDVLEVEIVKSSGEEIEE